MTVLMLNGELLAPDEATLPVTDRALTHGLGLYETLKLVGGVPVFFEEHVARLDLGLEELGLERPCLHARSWPHRSAGCPRPATCRTAPAGCWSRPGRRKASPACSSRPTGGSSRRGRCASSPTPACACVRNSRR